MTTRTRSSRRIAPRTAIDHALAPRVELAPKSMLVAASIAGGAWLLVQLFPVLLVLVVALFLVAALNPIIEWLEAHRFNRTWAIALVFVLGFVLCSSLAALTIPALVAQGQALIEKEPELRKGLADRLAAWPLSAGLAEPLRNVHYDELAKGAAAKLFDYSTRALEIVAYAASAVFLALYILIDRDRLRGGLFATLPRGQHVRLARVLVNVETIVGGYIRGQVITSALMAAFAFALLTACGVQSPVALATFAGAADVLPYIGVFLSVGPAVLATIPRGLVIVLVVLFTMLAYEELESRVLIPRIYGRALRLPSSVVMFALIAGGSLMGILGALLALPVAATIRMLIYEIHVDLPGEPTPTRELAEDARQQDEYERRTAGKPAEQASAIAVQITEPDRPQNP